MRAIYTEADSLTTKDKPFRYAKWDRFRSVIDRGRQAMATIERRIMSNYIHNWRADCPSADTEHGYAARIQFEKPDYFSPAFEDLLAFKNTAYHDLGDTREWLPAEAWVNSYAIERLFFDITWRCVLCGQISGPTAFHDKSLGFNEVHPDRLMFDWLISDHGSALSCRTNYRPICHHCYYEFSAASRRMHRAHRSPLFDNEVEYVSALHDLTRRKRFKERLRKYADTPLSFNPLKARAS